MNKISLNSAKLIVKFKKTLPYKSVMTETVAGIYFCQCQIE